MTKTASAALNTMTYIASFPADTAHVAQNSRMGRLPKISIDAGIRDSSFGPYTAVGARTKIAESEFGDYSYIVEDGQVIYSTVGKFCSIAASVRLNPGNHPTWRASQHHFTYRCEGYDLAESDALEFFNWRRSHPVTLGHDVWIGHGVTVMPGVSIGTGAVVGSGAVVTKDVAPYTIVAGVAAKPIKDRFPARQAEQLLQLAWWDWPHALLREALPDFKSLSLDDFLVKYQDIDPSLFDDDIQDNGTA